MRLLLAPLAMVLGLVALTAAAPPARDWTTAVRQTPAGAYVVGNPAAPAKLVEYASYTCSHCAAFSTESRSGFHDRMIRNGSASLELRHLIRDPLDLAAAILARCTGPRGFDAATAQIMATQPTWIAKAVAWQDQHPEAAKLPQDARLRAFADGSGLTAMIRARGLAPAAIDACFANKAEIARIVKMGETAPAEVEYTPFFFLNGKAVPSVDWAKLEPLLRAAGAK